MINRSGDPLKNTICKFFNKELSEKIKAIQTAVYFVKKPINANDYLSIGKIGLHERFFSFGYNIT